MSPRVYLCFCKGTGWLSRIIEWFAPGPSHAFVAYQSPDWGGPLQVGSEVGGWVTMPAESAGSVCAVYELPGVDVWKGLRANRRWLGAPYDVGGLLGMAVVMVWWRAFRRRVRNPGQSSASWFCSEIVARVLRDSGCALELQPGETDPGRLEIEIIRLGGVQRSWEEVAGKAEL